MWTPLAAALILVSTLGVERQFQIQPPQDPPKRYATVAECVHAETIQVQFQMAMAGFAAKGVVVHCGPVDLEHEPLERVPEGELGA